MFTSYFSSPKIAREIFVVEVPDSGIVIADDDDDDWGPGYEIT